MASGTPKVPIVQQNGTPIMNLPTGPQLRPQFRRQGSSFGGTGFVSPMAVMPMPTKVDYSVTKGGLRLWAVLFVFIFLCSSLYALFSTKELAEMAVVDIEEELKNDVEQELDDNAEEVAAQNRKVDHDTTVSKDNIPPPRSLNDARKVIAEERNFAEKDESEEEHLDQEEELFAKLRAKADERSRKQKVDKGGQISDVNQDEDDQEEKEDETPKDSKRRLKRRKKVNGETDDEQIEVYFDKGVDELSGENEVEKKVKLRRKCESSGSLEKQNNKNSVEEGKDKEEEIIEAAEGYKFNEGEDQSSKFKSEKRADEGNVDEELEKEDESQQIQAKKENLRLKKVQRFGVGIGTPKTLQVTETNKKSGECKRKNCPVLDEGKPRKELLKQKSRKSMLRLNKKYKVIESEEDEIEDEETPEGEEEVKVEIVTENEQNEPETSEENQEISAAKFERLQDRKAYKRHAITNRDDDRFRVILDKADNLVEKHEYTTAFALFDRVLEQNEDSPRAHFGKARAYEIRSDSEADGSLLDLAINEYQAVLKNDDSPDALYNQAASRLIERARFRGLLHKVLMAQRALIDRFPDDPELQNDFALTFLMMGREDDAFKVYNDVLKLYPENGMAQAYYGFIQKLRGNFDDAVLFMRKGFRGTQRKITDPRFYYHFGDALMRLGKAQEAYEVYSEGAKIGLFLSPYQRSLHNFRGLSAKPWWGMEQTTYAKFLKVLEKQWTVIREEAIILLKSHPEYFIAENPELTLFGNWSSFYFYRGWSWDENNCMKSRKTCELLREFRETSNSSKSEMKLSLLTSNSRVWPHCGYSNYRLQAHLGLVVPSGKRQFSFVLEARIRVADEIRGWKTGRFIIFDDSFEHELWFEGASANKYCLVLAIDLWHPDVASERRVDLGSL